MYYQNLELTHRCKHIVSFGNYDYYSSEIAPVIFGIGENMKGFMFNYRKEDYYNQILSIVFDIAWHEDKIFFMPKHWLGRKEK